MIVVIVEVGCVTLGLAICVGIACLVQELLSDEEDDEMCVIISGGKLPGAQVWRMLMAQEIMCGPPGDRFLARGASTEEQQLIGFQVRYFLAEVWAIRNADRELGEK